MTGISASRMNAAHGPSGDEGGVRAKIEELARPYADEMIADTLGNLIVRKKGAAQKKYCSIAASIALSWGTGAGRMYSSMSGAMTAGTAPYSSYQYLAAARCSSGAGHSFQPPKGK